MVDLSKVNNINYYIVDLMVILILMSLTLGFVT